MAEPTRSEEDRLPEGEMGRSDSVPSPQLPDTPNRPVGDTTVWALVVWGAVVVGASIPLAILGVSLWWLVPVLGAMVPLVFVALQNRTRGSSAAVAAGKALRAPSEPLAEPLSDREMDVLRLLASGLTNREIADDLFIAVGTVKNHTNGIYRKLGVHNRAGALSRARELNLLD